MTCDLISGVMSGEICVPCRFNGLKLVNFGMFAGDMDMDRCWEVISVVRTDTVTFPRSSEVIRGQ